LFGEEMSNNFEEFLSKNQTEIVEDAIDWSKRLDDWQNHLSKFYDVVDASLKQYIDDKKVLFTVEEKDIEEEYIGPYKVKAARIKIGNSTARLDPIGTLLIGSKGRVDLVGPGGTARFVLVDAASGVPKMTVTIVSANQPPLGTTPKPPIDWVWRRATPPPNVTYLPFHEESFKDALIEVLNG
jgi:hypothetical protein